MEPRRGVLTCPESQVELGHFVLLIGRDLTLALGLLWPEKRLLSRRKLWAG